MTDRRTLPGLLAVLLAAATTAPLPAGPIGADESGFRPEAATERSNQLDPPPAIRELVEAMRLPVTPSLPGAPLPGDFIDAGRGPIPVFVPSSYDPEVPTPVVILLHGYTGSGQNTESWMQLTPLAEEYGLLYLYPDGTRDCFGQRFWNATDACCNFCGSGVDDSGYLRDVVELMRETYNVDPRRIHFAGHSNGGFMSYRMACDNADLVASVASFAGATFLDPGACTPVVPVSTLQVHGTADAVIDYDGGCIGFNCYPGAVESTEIWAAYGGCRIEGEELPDRLDVDAGIPGAETVVTRYARDCDPGGSAELWTVAGGSHSPPLTDEFRRALIEFLVAHPKPRDCPADLDESGVVDFADLLAVLAAWGPCPGCPEDLDDSGEVDFQDILVVLAAWGPCD